MKVLLVSDSFFASRGYGVSRHVSTLSKFLAKQGVEVHLLTEAVQTNDAELSSAGVNIIRRLRISKNQHSLHWPFLYLRNSMEIAKAIGKYGESFDVVHYHGSHYLFMSQIRIRTPLVSTVHGILPACIMYWGNTAWCGSRPSSLRCTLCTLRVRKSYAPLALGMMTYCQFFYNFMNLSLRSLKILASVSKYVENVLRAAYRLNNTVTIHNFIDISEIVQAVNMLRDFDARSYLKVPDTMKMIFYSGRLSHDKGLLSLVEAFKLISKEEKNVFLIITGEGYLRPYLEDVASQLGNVILTGYLPRSILLNLMSQADVFVAPSIYPDACPTTILEAMALSVPVVATIVGGIPELVVNNETGYMVRPNAPHDLASKILHVLSDDKKCFRRNSVERSHMFDITRLGQKIIDLYEKIEGSHEDEE